MIIVIKSTILNTYYILHYKVIKVYVFVHDPKIYMGFVDTPKVFDSVPRNQIWQKLKESRIKKEAKK